MAPTGTSHSDPHGPDPVRRPRPGPPATPADLRRAQYRDSALRTELDRVRTAAVAWRNGLGALLAGLIGFGLLKGHSDISVLALPAAVTVGVLLLVALASGTVGALKLLRSAHGRPRVVEWSRSQSESVAAHTEALESARSLRAGIAATIACAWFLVAAVAVSWYGPQRSGPSIRVTTGNTAVCGEKARVDARGIVLSTDHGEQTITTDVVRNLAPVTSC